MAVEVRPLARLSRHASVMRTRFKVSRLHNDGMVQFAAARDGLPAPAGQVQEWRLMRMRAVTIISLSIVATIAAGAFVVQLANRGRAESSPAPMSPTSTSSATPEPQATSTSQPASDDSSDSVTPPETESQSAKPKRDPFELLRSGQYADATQLFRASVAAKDPPSAADSIGLIQCAIATGDYESAKQAVESINQPGSSDPDARYWAARLAFIQGGYEQAIQHCRSAILLDRTHARARLLLAQLLELTDQPDEAMSEYEWFDRVAKTRLPDDAERLTAVGQGFYRYSVLTEHPDLVRRTRHVLNKILQIAGERLDESHWPARVAAGDLLREKYNIDEARTEYIAALDINTNCVEAMVGLGRLAIEKWDFEEIDKQLDRAQSVNPRHPGALHLRARSRFLERRFRDAVDACDRALAVNPNDIEALSLAAAAYRAMYDTTARDAMIARVATINPKCSRMHKIMGDALGVLLQYAEAEEHYLKAIAFEPTDPSPRIELGLLYMRWGDEIKARQTLDDAWRMDAFNELTKNTLDLLDRLIAFDTLESEHFIIRYDGEKDALVAPLIQRHLESVHAKIRERFDANLERKAIVEVFPVHSEFGVRVTGKPWIHTVGACTGWLIAIDSPRGGPGQIGPYDLANVLTHEYTHTVTLAVTNNRIPRWMTEGLAVLTEETPKNYRWMELLARAIRGGDLFTLQSIDWGFIRPKKPWHSTMAYAQGEWMCEYLIQSHGENMIRGMLAAFAEGQSQAEVFQKVVGVSEADFDAQFAAWAKIQAATNWAMDVTPVDDIETIQSKVDQNDRDPELWARLARARYDEEDVAAAIDAARRSIDLAETDQPSALRVLAMALMDHADGEPEPKARRARQDEALDAAERLIKIRKNDAAGLKVLSRIYIDRKFIDLAEDHLLRLQKAQPHDPFSAMSLAMIYLAREDDDAALRQFQWAADRGDHDAELRRRVSRIYARRDQLDQARSWLDGALMINPYSIELRTELAQILARMGQTEDAARQYGILCDLAPDVAAHWSRAAMAYHQIGERDDALRCAKRAIALDPDSPARALLD